MEYPERVSVPVKSAVLFHIRENLTPVEHPEGTRFNPSTISRTYGAPIAGSTLRSDPDGGISTSFQQAKGGVN